MRLVKIQAEITGYGGQAINLLGMKDTQSGLMLIAKELPVGERIEGALLVTNNPRIERDRLFSEDDLEAAIRQFFSARALGLIDLQPNVQKHDPQNRIQTASMGERGARYELSPEVSNGNVAVLAIGLAAETVATAEDLTQMASEMADMFATI